MDASSTTSSRQPASRRIPWIGLALVLVATLWVLVLVGAGPLSRFAGDKYGALILKGSKGLVTSPSRFLESRCHEVAILVTALTALGFLFFFVKSVLPPTVGVFSRGTVLGVFLFLLANGFSLFLYNAFPFWFLLTAEEAPLPQFHLKRILSRENGNDVNVFITGSSQANTEILEQVLDSDFPGYHFNDLHFAGSKGFDFLLLWDQFAANKPKYLIGYLSEYNFYPADTAARLYQIPSLHGLNYIVRHGDFDGGYRVGFINGITGFIFPLYRCRTGVSDRIFPNVTLASLSRSRKRAPAPPSPTRESSLASLAAEEYRIDGNSAFQKKAFDEFLQNATASGSSIILCVGQINPAVYRFVTDDVKKDFLEYIESIKKKYPRIQVLDRTSMPEHKEEDYKDFTHVKKEAQFVYTRALSQRLGDRLGKPSLQPSQGKGD